jgi:hypothetical protein
MKVAPGLYFLQSLRLSPASYIADAQALWQNPEQERFLLCHLFSSE